MRNGGKGCITATANVNPAADRRICIANWKTADADALQARLDAIRGDVPEVSDDPGAEGGGRALERRPRLGHGAPAAGGAERRRSPAALIADLEAARLLDAGTGRGANGKSARMTPPSALGLGMSLPVRSARARRGVIAGSLAWRWCSRFVARRPRRRIPEPSDQAAGRVLRRRRPRHQLPALGAALVGADWPAGGRGNRPGASGEIAVKQAITSKPDGYTLSASRAATRFRRASRIRRSISAAT